MSDSYPLVYQTPIWISHKYICLQIQTRSHHLYPPRRPPPQYAPSPAFFLTRPPATTCLPKQSSSLLSLCCFSKALGHQVPIVLSEPTTLNPVPPQECLPAPLRSTEAAPERRGVSLVWFMITQPPAPYSLTEPDLPSLPSGNAASMWMSGQPQGWGSGPRWASSSCSLSNPPNSPVVVLTNTAVFWKPDPARSHSCEGNFWFWAKSLT